MKSYTPADVEKARAWAESQGFEKETFNIPHLILPYYVLPRSLNPELPNFVWQCITSDMSDAVYGVSDETPSDFRPVVIYHEHLEAKMRRGLHITLGRRTPCVSALILELSEVPMDKRPEYVLFRRDFFRNLVKYAEAHKEDYEDTNDIEWFKESLSHLEALAEAQR